MPIRLRSARRICYTISIYFYAPPPCEMPRFSGFTLIELLVVITIIAILAAIIIATLRNRASQASHDSVTLDERDQVRAALQLYYFNHGGYPYLSNDACVGASSCVLASQTEAGPLAGLGNSFSVGTLPAVSTYQGFVYIPCATGSVTNGLCPSGTSYVAYPTNAAGGRSAKRSAFGKPPMPIMPRQAAALAHSRAMPEAAAALQASAAPAQASKTSPAMSMPST